MGLLGLHELRKSSRDSFGTFRDRTLRIHGVFQRFEFVTRETQATGQAVIVPPRPLEFIAR